MDDNSGDDITDDDVAAVDCCDAQRLWPSCEAIGAFLFRGAATPLLPRRMSMRRIIVLWLIRETAR